MLFGYTSSTAKAKAWGVGLLVTAASFGYINYYRNVTVRPPSTFTKEVAEFEDKHVFRNDRYNDDQMFFDYSKDTAYWPKFDRRDEELGSYDREGLEALFQRNREAFENLSPEHKRYLDKMAADVAKNSAV